MGNRSVQTLSPWTHFRRDPSSMALLARIGYRLVVCGVKENEASLVRMCGAFSYQLSGF